MLFFTGRKGRNNLFGGLHIDACIRLDGCGLVKYIHLNCI
jgi:hypothetical protein